MFPRLTNQCGNFSVSAAYVDIKYSYKKSIQKRPHSVFSRIQQPISQFKLKMTHACHAVREVSVVSILSLLFPCCYQFQIRELLLQALEQFWDAKTDGLVMVAERTGLTCAEATEQLFPRYEPLYEKCLHGEYTERQFTNHTWHITRRPKQSRIPLPVNISHRLNYKDGTVYSQ
jgi:hypothetical protein